MVNVTRYSVTHISVVVTLLVALLLGGVYAFWQLGKREDSTFTIKSAVVVAPYAGATPDEVERLVVEPLERELRTLSHLYALLESTFFDLPDTVRKNHGFQSVTSLKGMLLDCQNAVWDLNAPQSGTFGERMIQNRFQTLWQLDFL